MDLSPFWSGVSPFLLVCSNQVDSKRFPENTQRCVPNLPLRRGSVCHWAPATLRVQTPAVVHATPLCMTRFVHWLQIRTCLLIISAPVLIVCCYPPLRVVQLKSCHFCTLEVRTMLPGRTCLTCWGSPLSSMSLPTAPTILRTLTSTRASQWRTTTKPTSAPGSTRRSNLSVSSLSIFTTDLLWSPVAAVGAQTVNPTAPPCLSLLCPLI